MLYVYFGNDTARVRQKAFAFLENHLGETSRPTSVESHNYVSGMLDELARSASLFGKVNSIILDMLGDETDVLEQVIEAAPMLKDSANHFLIIEKTLSAPQKKALEPHAGTFEEIKADGKERFNTFLLTDALLRKDKKSLWFLLMEAWREGVSNEEIIGAFFWQVKTLRLVEKTKNEKETGVKPFVYGKAKRALPHFKRGELDALSAQLILMYHDGHLGRTDLSTSLEQWVLTL
jgi:DNA polymerase III delta subunit